MKRVWIKPERSIPWQSKPQRILYHVCAVCLAIYVAYVTFLSNSGLFSSAADTIAALLWFVVLAVLAYAGLGWIVALPGKHSVPETRGQLSPKVFAIATVVPLTILAIYLMAAYPGGVSVDAAVQWTQANTGVYSDWHPVFHTLLLGSLAHIKPNYTFVVAMQCGVFSLSVGYLVATLHAWGIRLWPVLVVTAIAVTAPITGHTMMFLWKDNAMTIGVVLLTAQAVNLYYSRGAWLGKMQNALAFGLALAFTTLVRHNGFFFTMPLLVMVAFSCKAQLKGTLVTGATMVVILSLVWGPLYTALHVTYPSNTLEESIGIPMTILSDIRKQNPTVLDGETIAFTDAMADEAGWQAYQLHNYNSIKFGATRDVVAKTTLSQVLRMTVNTAKADPRNAFLAVNGVTDLVWGLDNEGAANVTVRNSGDLPSLMPGNGLINHLGAALKAFVSAPLRLWPLSWYIGNLGFPLLALLVLSLRAIRRNGVRALVLCLPVLLYNLGTMCLLCGNDARFFSYTLLVSTLSLFVLWPSLPSVAAQAEKAEIT